MSNWLGVSALAGVSEPGEGCRGLGSRTAVAMRRAQELVRASLAAWPSSAPSSRRRDPEPARHAVEVPSSRSRACPSASPALAFTIALGALSPSLASSSSQAAGHIELRSTCRRRAPPLCRSQAQPVVQEAAWVPHSPYTLPSAPNHLHDGRALTSRRPSVVSSPQPTGRASRRGCRRWPVAPPASRRRRQPPAIEHHDGRGHHQRRQHHPASASWVLAPCNQPIHPTPRTVSMRRATAPSSFLRR